MFECKKCGQFFVGRSQLLVHSVRDCSDLATATPDIDEEAETTADDEDADPNWSPTPLRDTTISCLTHDDIESSPITQEQIEEAAIVEAIICAEDVSQIFVRNYFCLFSLLLVSVFGKNQGLSMSYLSSY
ncbi:uncharacterized protein LOC120353177 [Nilaparvata lugens]|uniref:uncharacterized protein LOC120353177 n=1 Tax=Nilaparvata lugens TaxID=108931 RepID=UPI00193E2E3F|nr:uncharacterized protein LOC120353177 [Nilaparvata lugens]